jgi:hypothetical protein
MMWRDCKYGLPRWRLSVPERSDIEDAECGDKPLGHPEQLISSGTSGPRVAKGLETVYGTGN